MLDVRRREQRPDPRQRHAAHVGVARVVDGEVVPEHAAARLHPAPHCLGQALLEGVVEQRREDGGDEDDVETRLGDRGRARVAAGQGQGRRQACSSRRVPLRQQLDAGQVLGAKAEHEQLEQVAAAAAADLEQAQSRQVGETVPREQPQQRPLPFLHRHQGGRPGQAVAVVVDGAARVTCANRVGLAARRLLAVGHVAHRVSVEKRSRGDRSESTSKAPTRVPMP